MAEEITNMDNGEERLLKIAGDLLEAGNLIDAVRMVTRSVELHGHSIETHCMLGKIYGAMELTDDALSAWFCALAGCYRLEDDGKDASTYVPKLPEIYEGIIKTLLLLGNTDVADTYGEKLINEIGSGDSDDDEYLYQTLMCDFYDEAGVPLEGEEEEDPTADPLGRQLVGQGLILLQIGDIDDAVEEFKKVNTLSPEYLMAQSCIAMAYATKGENDTAAEYCTRVLEENPDYIPALTVLATICMAEDDEEAAKEIAAHFVGMDLKEDGDIAKVVPILISCDMPEAALAALGKHSSKYDYDLLTMHLKAVAYCDCGKLEEAKKTLRDIVYVYPDSVQTKKRLKDVSAAQKAGTGIELDMDYFSDEEHSAEYIAKCLDFIEGSAAKRKKIDRDELREAVLWITDPYTHAEGYSSRVGFDCAVYAGFDDVWQRMLLDHRVSELAKFGMLETLFRLNKTTTVYVASCMSIKTIDIDHVRLGKLKKNVFLNPYAELTAKLCIIDEDLPYQLAVATEILYDYCEDTGVIDGLTEDDNDTIMAAIYTWADLDVLPIDGGICKFFGGKARVYKKLIPKRR
ncbi:MAG: hypothetical protein LUD47_06130 [Clostridia bacterium]|nr:hypothetical protein [Clostridia bacterium]